MAGCTAAYILGWLHQTAEFAKGASCASLTFKHRAASS
ncbi:hypothetical protein JL2886_01113 [Phaeobacter gallaeciensis]|uniref:Uncharacterized protein n=1 Tax=Phaeobacter gallaeciensis TaxID=60890 RepID=A0A1B0ZPM6_9RHOB|nr:hypothetical protein JL2886_01113 [Phaeobacter gallaeciensis]